MLPQLEPKPLRGRRSCDVLIAEADPLCARAFEHSLRLAGFTVERARSGREVLSVAQAVRPGLVLLDWGMPELDGPSCTRLLKRAYGARNILVIAMSATELPEDRPIALRAGCDGFLNKPVSFLRLLSEIRHALGLDRSAASALAGAPRPLRLAAGSDQVAE
jgi:two-component system cell cycle response regulator DivK